MKACSVGRASSLHICAIRRHKRWFHWCLEYWNQKISLNEVLFVSALAFDSFEHLLICRMPLMKMFPFGLIFVCFLALREQIACLTHPDRWARQLCSYRTFFSRRLQLSCGEGAWANAVVSKPALLKTRGGNAPGIVSACRFGHFQHVEYGVETTMTFPPNPGSLPCYFSCPLC